MRKFALLISFILILSFTACTEQQEQSISENESVSPESSSALETQPSETQVPDFEPSSAAEEAADDGETVVYKQRDASDEDHAATLTISPDGKFKLCPIMYDGIPSITGTYIDNGEGFVLTPLETTAFNIDLHELGIIEMAFDGEELIYHGSQIGETADGSVFTK